MLTTLCQRCSLVVSRGAELTGSTSLLFIASTRTGAGIVRLHLLVRHIRGIIVQRGMAGDHEALVVERMCRVLSRLHIVGEVEG